MASHRLNPLYAIKECSSCGSLYTRECCSIGSLENKILVPEPDSSPCCAKCGTPVDGPYCRGCALLRKKFEEDLLTYCVENGIFQDSQDTFESSDDNTNVINALQEPIVVNQDPGVKSSQENLEEIKRDRRKKIVDMSIEEIRHEQQLVDYKIKDITNDLGYKRFRGEKIDEEYEKDYEIRIRKLKQDFNEWGSEARKKEQAYNEEQYFDARRRMLSIPFVDQDDYIPLGDIIARYSTISKSLEVNPTPDRVLESPSPFPIPIADNSLPEYDAFLFEIKPDQEVLISIDNSNNSLLELPEYDSFLFEIEPDQEVLISIDNSNNFLLELPEFESFHFDPSFPRPPPEPPDVEKCLEPEAGVADVSSKERYSFEPKFAKVYKAFSSEVHASRLLFSGWGVKNLSTYPMTVGYGMLEEGKSFRVKLPQRYGNIKNHKKTVKNGQTRTRERKSVQEPEAR
ncbi:hypothetical protein Tco_0576208, partial [Tanacetum coccineum]